ncbi:HEAT repeat domain-containing protein [Nannocystis pusilla]|uniref:HEAT repeat domain-containing protein n=1 Tax=Nannocystis pusilla TaxID=889268 RepID=A0A9X3EMX7_9BACT|nr:MULTISPECIES: HEAT repeat domain-containing protein [Nannocystis]MCY0985621.1 HEAT repeat domain-containing protein [Nannocystis sp. ILAH1]MCY1006099.1 HEAT repeat domain-containing protein [Nannocystis pusilla]MCY1068307.1 HEAT repeat domain-containing protein [Nannocystis sp. RBIL2]
MIRLRAALALVLFASACGESDGGRYPVRLSLALPGEAADLESPVSEALQVALRDSAIFAPDGASGSTVHGEATLTREAAEAPWILHVGMAVPDDLRSKFAVSAITSSASAGTDAFRPSPEALAEAARRAITGLEAQCRLARGDASGLEVLLSSGEPSQILVALRYVSDREAREHAGRLLPLLRSEDTRVRMAVLDVLGTVGTFDHAAAIVREVHRLDPGATREAYRALARLGGTDAVGFLRFAAANEDDPELRAEAERALSSALSGKPPSAAEVPRGVDLPKLARGHRQ